MGHSLGAGTASLLAMLLKPAYPTLQCYGYGYMDFILKSVIFDSGRFRMPGSMLDEATAQGDFCGCF